MLFMEKKDKKYIHMFPLVRVKYSFDLRLAVNTVLEKYAVRLTPTLRPNEDPSKDNPLIVNLHNLLSNDQSH